MSQSAFIAAPALTAPRHPPRSGRRLPHASAARAAHCRAIARPRPVTLSTATAPLPRTLAAAVAPAPRRAAALALSLSLLVLGSAAWPVGMARDEFVVAPAPPRETPLVEEAPAVAIDVPQALIAEEPPASSLVPEEVLRAIKAATRSVGVDTGYLTVVAARESGFDPSKRAQRTTATGLYQFTDDTWLRVVKLFGAKYGLGNYAQQIVLSPNDGVSLPHPRARETLLQLRSDPQLSALMAAELALDNKGRLEHLLGRIVTPAETYLAHFFGVVPAARIIDAARTTPRVPAASLLPTAAQSNPKLFSPSGGVASAHALISAIEANFARQTLHFAG